VAAATGSHPLGGAGGVPRLVQGGRVFKAVRLAGLAPDCEKRQPRASQPSPPRGWPFIRQRVPDTCSGEGAAALLAARLFLPRSS